MGSFMVVSLDFEVIGDTITSLDLIAVYVYEHFLEAGQVVAPQVVMLSVVKERINSIKISFMKSPNCFLLSPSDAP